MEKKRTKKQVKAIKINIKRRTVIVDDKLVFKNKIPLPSWIELSIIDVCNRTCKFCPKSDPSIAPDTYQKMEKPLITKLCKDLKEMGFKNVAHVDGGFDALRKSGFQVVQKEKK